MIRFNTRALLNVRSVYTGANGSGPHGVDGRLPLNSIGSKDDFSPTITDPFVLYQNYVAQGILTKDEYQLRVMKEFQKLYFRLIDYRPPSDLSIKVSIILRKLEIRRAEELAHKNKSLVTKLSLISNLFRSDPDLEKKELIRILSDEDEAYLISSPQGLLLNGEVGCGKSMLMDMFAQALPHESKMRWHYNNFILWVYNQMYQIQQERRFTSIVYNGMKSRHLTIENEFVLFEVAQKMIQKSTVLMLDEFMLPDVASANVVKVLLTYYFKLGGVLVATSNKLPQDLYSNEFNRKSFTGFVGILGTRCNIVDMRSDIDYRTLMNDSNENREANIIVKSNNSNHGKEWANLIKNALEEKNGLPDQYNSFSLKVYGRTTIIPKSYCNDTICLLDFLYICQGLYSSSDYITLASQYKVIILDNVPIMTMKMKNEARRFITLLDAIYESKCQFYIRTEVPVDELFFPDSTEDSVASTESTLQVQAEEMFAKTVMDMESPYRPNAIEYTREFDESSSATPKIRNFLNTTAFTGEDEKFAYKRAVLRIKEMTGSKQWKSNTWVPIDSTMRPWEDAQNKYFSTQGGIENEDITNKDEAPRFGQHHFWALGPWTILNGKRLQDQIAKRWIRSGIKSEVEMNRAMQSRNRDE